MNAPNQNLIAIPHPNGYHGVLYIYIYALMLAGTLGSELLKCSMVDEMA
jgi:hypothetical protein